MKKEKKEIVSKTLYQKYRPQNFAEVVGQDEVVNSLEKSIKEKKISHAYLFSGGRGSGKTSIARIFAKRLEASENDIYEIDAASNRGIDQIRELRNSAEILPIDSDYKVFIIDEFHMLTKEASNALLKTLEEPPKHVIFILATTEKHKILDTIMSRCQVFDFRKANIKDLSRLIKDVAKEEKIKIDELSIEHIAKIADGSFRDGLSHFQKSISLFGENISFEEIKKSFSNSLFIFDEFTESLSEKNFEKIFEIYENFLESNGDVEFFVSEILEKIRMILLVQNSKTFEEKFCQKFSKEYVQSLKNKKGITSKNLKDFLEIFDEVKKSENKKAAFEILLHNLN